MLNSSGLQSNSSQVSVTVIKIEHLKMILASLIIVCFFCLFYFMAVMLHVFITISSIRETSRYILFLHMLINDTCYIAFGTVLLLAAIYHILIPGPLCYLLFIIGSATFKATAYNLATMSLERYVAICHPLHHGRLCTTHRTHVAIALMWLMGCIPYVAEIVLILSSHNVISSVPVICSQVTMIVNPAQNIIRSQSLFIGFSTVGLIILFTYVRIILVAQKINSQSSTALKAGKTVLLHAFQLCLCMASLLSTLTETFPYNYNDFIPTVNFLTYSCVPRFLSPLIYGLRDKVLRKYIRQGAWKGFIWTTGCVSKS